MQLGAKIDCVAVVVDPTLTFDFELMQQYEPRTIWLY